MSCVLLLPWFHLLQQAELYNPIVCTKNCQLLFCVLKRKHKDYLFGNKDILRYNTFYNSMGKTQIKLQQTVLLLPYLKRCLKFCTNYKSNFINIPQKTDDIFIPICLNLNLYGTFVYILNLISKEAYKNEISFPLFFTHLSILPFFASIFLWVCFKCKTSNNHTPQT